LSGGREKIGMGRISKSDETETSDGIGEEAIAVEMSSKEDERRFFNDKLLLCVYSDIYVSLGSDIYVSFGSHPTVSHSLLLYFLKQ
jgi:hypothetical protein